MFFICLFNDAELNCVKTNILLIFELIQFEIGISTNRYFPAIGTAGLDLFSVSGYNRDPWPPPKMILKTLLFIISYLIKDLYIASVCFAMALQSKNSSTLFLPFFAISLHSSLLLTTLLIPLAKSREK